MTEIYRSSEEYINKIRAILKEEGWEEKKDFFFNKGNKTIGITFPRMFFHPSSDEKELSSEDLSLLSKLTDILELKKTKSF